MRYQLLRNFCSRGSSSSIHTILKTLGLMRQPDCLPFSAEAYQPGVPPNLFSEPTPNQASGQRRLLYLTHRFYPESSRGTEAFLARLSAAQQNLGNNVRIITLSAGFLHDYPEKIGGMRVRRYTWDGVEVLAIRYRNPPPGLYYERIDDTDPVQRLFAQWCMDEFHPDLVHAVYPQPFAAFLQVCREKTVPYMVTATDFCTICPRGTLIEHTNSTCQGSLRGERCLGGKCGTRFERAERMLLEANFFTVPSVFSAKRFAAEMSGLQPIVIPHDLEPGFSYKHRTEVRNFAYFGSLTWSKGALVLVRAFRKLDYKGTLSIYGNGPLRFLLKIYSLLDRRIHIMGSVPRKLLPSCHEQADCVVIPSRTAESYSLVLSEAIASGCMIIASDIGALSQRVQEAGGRIFPAGDSDALYKAMRDAIRSPVFPSNRQTTAESECETYETLYCKVVQK